MDGTGFKKEEWTGKKNSQGLTREVGRRVEGGPQMSHLMLTGTHQRKIIFCIGNLSACLHATYQWGSQAATEPDSGM